NHAPTAKHSEITSLATRKSTDGAEAQTGSGRLGAP
ncbi:MAG: hypothetical protein QOC79_2857, partial [Actinomycetota bacterium]|nr:hypothetical protein [Actinomycetota bacterium]